MAGKPTYEQLEQRVKELEKEVAERKKAEEALRALSSRQEALLSAIPDIVMEVDSNKIYTWANQSGIEFFGEEVIGNEAAFYFEGEQNTYNQAQPLFNGSGNVIYIESWQRRKDREKRLLAWWSTVLKDTHGNVAGAISSARDITEQILTEDALRESEEKYRHLFEMESDAIFLIRNGDGQIIEVNTAAARLYGFSREELLRMKNTDLSAEPDKTRKATLKQKREVPTRYHKKKEGTVFSVEITATHFTWRGEEVHIASIRDITERKQAEEALRENESKFRSLFELSPQAIALTAIKNGKLIDVNNKFCELTKYAKNEVLGKTTTELGFYSEQNRNKFINELQKSGGVHGLGMDFRAKDGSILHALMFAIIIQISGETFILTIFLDVTGQKKLEAQLQHAQRMEAIGTLAGGIAHDFNNLMMGMLGNISLMLFDTEPSYRHYDKLKNIEKLIENGSKLTNQILGYARRGKYEIKPTILNHIVKESSETFGRTRKEITIHRELADDLFATEVDESQIQQVLMNLYVNSANAMPGGGDLILKTMNVSHQKMRDKPYKVKSGNYVMLKVTDNGTGMDKKTTERIFEPFFTTKEMGRGTGLGLASAYGIIKGHGGYVDVDSKEGLGTSFYIYLPASDKAIPKTFDTYNHIMESSGTILLVDDEAIIVDVGAQMLKKIGYTVLKAQSGKEAIELYRENIDKIDLVILDMIMPYIGGGEAYEKIKEINPKAKVLLSSGYSVDGKATEILERGCNGFIQKPFNIGVLSQKIMEILGKD